MTQKLKLTFLLMRLLSMGTAAIAQQSITSALSEIEKNNPSIMALKSQLELQKAEMRTELAPPNPTLEGGRFPAVKGGDMKYMWGVSQSFEFPTVYAKRSQLAKTNDQYAQSVYSAQRQEVLLDVKYTLLELVHKQQLLNEYQKREVFAQNMLHIMQKKMSAGDATRMDLNYAKLRLTEIQQNTKSMAMQQNILRKNIEILNGNQPLPFTDSVLVLPALENNDDLVAQCMGNDPRVVALNQMVDVAHRNKQLVTHQGLPEISIGYEAEMTDHEHFRGVHAGISIPLWGNVGKSKAAKLQYSASQTERTTQVELIQMEYISLYQSAQNAYEQLHELQEAYKEFNNLSLLNRALEAGQISVITYFDEVIFLYEIIDRIMELELEYAKYHAALHRFEL